MKSLHIPYSPSIFSINSIALGKNRIQFISGCKLQAGCRSVDQDRLGKPLQLLFLYLAIIHDFYIYIVAWQLVHSDTRPPLCNPPPNAQCSLYWMFSSNWHRKVPSSCLEMLIFSSKIIRSKSSLCFYYVSLYFVDFGTCSLHSMVMLSGLFKLSLYQMFITSYHGFP